MAESSVSSSKIQQELQFINQYIDQLRKRFETVFRNTQALSAKAMELGFTQDLRSLSENNIIESKNRIESALLKYRAEAADQKLKMQDRHLKISEVQIELKSNQPNHINDENCEANQQNNDQIKSKPVGQDLLDFENPNPVKNNQSEPQEPDKSDVQVQIQKKNDQLLKLSDDLLDDPENELENARRALDF